MIMLRHHSAALCNRVGRGAERRSTGAISLSHEEHARAASARRGRGRRQAPTMPRGPVGAASRRDEPRVPVGAASRRHGPRGPVGAASRRDEPHGRQADRGAPETWLGRTFAISEQRRERRSRAL
jgi:hypothetical protein